MNKKKKKVRCYLPQLHILFIAIEMLITMVLCVGITVIIYKSNLQKMVDNKENKIFIDTFNFALIFLGVVFSLLIELLFIRRIKEKINYIAVVKILGRNFRSIFALIMGDEKGFYDLDEGFSSLFLKNDNEENINCVKINDLQIQGIKLYCEKNKKINIELLKNILLSADKEILFMNATICPFNFNYALSTCLHNISGEIRIFNDLETCSIREEAIQNALSLMAEFFVRTHLKFNRKYNKQ